MFDNMDYLRLPDPPDELLLTPLLLDPPEYPDERENDGVELLL